MSAYRDEHWRALCELLNRPELADDERFESNRSRVGHRSAMLEELDAEFGAWTTQEAVDLLARNGIVCAAINDYEQARHSKSFSMERQFVEALQGGVQMGFAAVLPYAESFGLDEPEIVPDVGSHTRSVLAELGLSDVAIETLYAKGIVDGSRNEESD